MKKIFLYSILLFSVFLFNLESINTIDSKVLVYDKNKLYIEKELDINFYSLNVKNLKEVFKDLNIEILSVKPMNELYYNENMEVSGNSLNEIVENLTEGYASIVKKLGYSDASLYFEINGFNIEKMRVRCLVKDLIELENRIDII